jgi:hypothetical protein
MTTNSDDLRKQLQEAARESVRRQLEHRSPPKARALLKALSKNTSDKPKQPASPKIQHGKPSLQPRFPDISPEELERLGVPTGPALIISPTPPKK